MAAIRAGYERGTGGGRCFPVAGVGICSTMIASRAYRRFGIRRTLAVGTAALLIGGVRLASVAGSAAPIVGLVLVAGALGIPNGSNDIAIEDFIKIGHIRR